MLRWRFLVLNLVLALALFGHHWASNSERVGVVPKDFLVPAAMPFRGWRVVEDKLTAREAEILSPDSTLLRRYESSSGDVVYLTVIAGSRKRSVHSPGFCMPGQGWETVHQQDGSLDLEGRSIPVTTSLMTNTKGLSLLATYFFTDGDYSTNDLVRFQGSLLLKRFRHDVPLGALVRILVPVRGNAEATEKLTREFASAVLPRALESLRLARQGRVMEQTSARQASEKDA